MLVDNPDMDIVPQAEFQRWNLFMGFDFTGDRMLAFSIDYGHSVQKAVVIRRNAPHFRKTATSSAHIFIRRLITLQRLFLYAKFNLIFLPQSFRRQQV